MIRTLSVPGSHPLLGLIQAVGEGTYEVLAAVGEVLGEHFLPEQSELGAGVKTDQLPAVAITFPHCLYDSSRIGNYASKSFQTIEICYVRLVWIFIRHDEDASAERVGPRESGLALGHADVGLLQRLLDRSPIVETVRSHEQRVGIFLAPAIRASVTCASRFPIFKDAHGLLEGPPFPVFGDLLGSRPDPEVVCSFEKIELFLLSRN